MSAVLAAAVVFGGGFSSAWAESNVTTPEEFIASLVVPDAKGKRISGILSVYYDLNADFGGLGCEPVIWNMALVATMVHKGKMKSFARDFFDESGIKVPPPYNNIAPFCRDDDAQQIDIILAFFRQDIVPFFYPCTAQGVCHDFKLKAIRRFEQVGGGAYALDLTIAVEVPGAGPDED